MSLVGFHTTLNAIGTVVAIPLAEHFARFVERIVRTRSAPLTHRLDERFIAADPPRAIEAATTTLRAIAIELMRDMQKMLRRETERTAPSVSALHDRARAIQETAEYLGAVRTTKDVPEHAAHMDGLHAADHLARIVERLEEKHAVLMMSSRDASFFSPIERLRDMAARLVSEVDVAERATGPTPSADLATLAQNVDVETAAARTETLRAVATGETPHDAGASRLEALHWIKRVAHHLEGLGRHL
jgi:Na+/phosphate symporter